jgi:hypothetical protein
LYLYSYNLDGSMTAVSSTAIHGGYALWSCRASARSARGARRVRERLRVSSASASVQGKSERESRDTWQQWWAHFVAWSPHRHCVKHVVGVDQPILEVVFGLAPL